MSAQNVFNIGDELSWEPRRLVFPGPWAGHIPFAFWMVKVLRPKMVVELGTHSGNSYSALCQAIQDFNVPSQSYAVDTWQGDEHSGNYDETVYEDLRRFNDLHYSSFSTLLRMTFDDARGYFKEASIDLLHIDGMHTYEAVKADFDNWRDALTDRGVVLFHDISVRERDFGVWRLWSELSQSHPSFEFHHSNGLGVLGVGTSFPPALQALFDAPQEQASEVRGLFAQAGKLFMARSDALAATIENKRREQIIGELNRSLANSNHALATLRQEIEVLKGERTDLKAFIDQERQAIERLTAEQAALHRMYQSSTSWRVTRPLRLAILVGKLMLRSSGRAQLRQIAAARSSRIRKPVTQALVRLREATKPSPARLKKQHRDRLAGRLRRFLTSGERLALPVSAEPDVSIVIIAYKQPELLLAALESIQSCLSKSALRIETIIWNNGSDEQTTQLLKAVSGVKHLQSEENLHFLLGVNRSVEAASGRHLLLLNSDAQLTAGSLEHAVARLDADQTIGAVGGRLILPDGKLQEAGSIIWNNGACVGYASGAEPERADVMFRRDVDYCSGAFLVTPRQLFLDMNRFDERYVPAYYEETDYCVRLWENGYRVVYDPAVVTHHFEFGSSATSRDALDLQRKNHAIFAEAHAGWLSSKHAPSEHAKLAARHGGSPKPRVLFIEDRVPHIELGAGYPRANAIIKELRSLGGQVTLFPMFDHRETWSDVWRSISPEVEVMLGSDADALPAFLAERRGLYDVVIVSRPHNMRKLAQVLAERPDALGGARLVYDAEAIFARRDELARQFGNAAVSSGSSSSALKEEIGLTRWADTILAVSRGEQEIFAAETGKPVLLLGHMLSPDVTTLPFEERTDVVFLGPSYDDSTPNADSLRWFAQSVLPAMRKTLGLNLRLKVIGTVDAPSIKALGKTELDLLGRVPDLKPIMEKARIVVIPTRFAAGVPHKAHQAAAFGVPIVATELIREQLDWENGQDLLAASDAGTFADHCCTLYQDAAVWQRLRSNALDRVRQDCSPEDFRNTLASLLPMPRGVGQAHGIAVSGQPLIDRSLAVPFSYPIASSNSVRKCAAVIHIFYEDMASSIRSYVDNVPGNLDLFISTDTPAKAERIKEAFSGWDKGTMELRIFPNRGRDIAPKVVGFRDVYDQYDLVLHLHSKASTHDVQLAAWRTFLMDHLVGSEKVVRSIFQIFDADPRVGIIAPQHLEYVRPWINWGVNFERGCALASRFGFEVSPDMRLDFPSGSMFWARTAALKPLLDLDLSFEDFEGERGQKDATLAHAVERVYFLACQTAGFWSVKVALPERFVDKSHLSFVRSEGELLHWLDQQVLEDGQLNPVNSSAGSPTQ
jgi:GT2 family glycosyltransferase